MTPEQLKASILQYAIQGKLVEQRAEEGTGEELFQEIERKREVLIKEKIIKKDKRTNSIIYTRLQHRWLDGNRQQNSANIHENTCGVFDKMLWQGHRIRYRYIHP